jgi:undecaprenyl-diphosphatase
MSAQPNRGFWTRRFARGEWLGLHLTLGLLVCLTLLAGFGLLAEEIKGLQPPAIDQRIYERLRQHRETSPAMRAAFLRITDVGTNRYIIPVVVLGAALWVWQRRFALAVVWVLVIAMAPMLNSEVKDIFKRARPPGIDPLAPESSYSFPSGHSMESMIAFGMMGYLLLVTLPPRLWMRSAAVASMSALILAVGFSRMYLSAHWFTDVAGGFTLGAAWSAAWITVLECGRRRTSVRVLATEKAPVPKS